MTKHGTRLDALLLVGGQGTRLSSVVSDRPKPMALVAGRPFVEWLLLSLKAQGIRRAIFCTGYKSEMVEAHFQNGQPWGMEVVYSREPQPLGTGGAIRNALAQIQSSSCLVLNGDSYCPVLVDRLQKDHVSNHAAVTLWLVWQSDCRRSGSVTLSEDGSVLEFKEKSPDLGAGLINAGIYLIDRDIIESLPAGKSSLETEIFPKLIGRGLYGVVGEGPFIDIGIPEAYAAAQQSIAWENLA